MEDSDTPQPLMYGRHELGTLDLNESLRFLLAVFDPDDCVLFRPIETWTEDGKKQSRVIYKQVLYRTANPVLMLVTTEQLTKVSDAEKANAFFGCCPRLGNKGRFDLAWQIRKVNCLWADIDHATVADVLKRCQEAGLPEPSIIVNSGNGVHLYWLLEEPYLITDAGEPAPVHTQWIEKDGKKKPRRYFLDEHGDEVPVEKRHLHPALSPQAQLVQDVLGGIASKIGGDHTTDLTRLLRVPGTLNRKNQRNGQEPVSCVLVQCDPHRRYPFTAFSHLADAAPEVEKRRMLEKIPLPVTRKITPRRQDTLNEHITRCQLAERGLRSEADYALCCFAIRSGVAQDVLWPQVADIGKFQEGGERYFERTWHRAETGVRTEQLQKASKGAKKTTAASCPKVLDLLDMPDDGTPRRRVVDPYSDEADDSTIVVDPGSIPVSSTLQQITNAMLGAKTAFLRAGQCVTVADNQPTTILAPQELAGYLNQFVEFYFMDGEGGEYKPLPTAYANTWLHNPGQRKLLPEIKLFTPNPVYSLDWQLVPPGYDASSGVYYAGEAIEPLAGTSHLDKLLQDFCFRDRSDGANYLGMLLTIPLITHFVGSKPAVLFNGNQPGLGKSILAQIIAILRDGRTVETATYNPNDEEYEKRLGSIVRRGVTTIITDNAKNQLRRAATIESGCLERAITDSILSFRLLGSSSDIRAENSHIFCITANAPDVSRDLVTRCVVVNLEHSGDPTRRTFTLADPEGYALGHRRELLGELLGMVERWKQAGRPEAQVDTRFNKRGWGRIIGGILAHNGYQGFLANAESAATEFDQTRREFGELVIVMHKEARRRLAPADISALANQNGLFSDELKDRSPRSQVTRIGLLLTRYVAERFELDAERSAVLVRHIERKGCEYSLKVEPSTPSPPLVPNVEGSLPNVGAETFGGDKSFVQHSLPNLPNVADLVLPTPRMCEKNEGVCFTHEVGALAKGSAGSTRSAAPVCDHLDPNTWVARDGAAFCPACDRFMGRLAAATLSR